jgi:hypothetical protein
MIVLAVAAFPISDRWRTMSGQRLSQLQRRGTTRFLERSSNFDAFPRGCARRHSQRESVLGKHRPWRGLWMLWQSENST